MTGKETPRSSKQPLPTDKKKSRRHPSQRIVDIPVPAYLPTAGDAPYDPESPQLQVEPMEEVIEEEDSRSVLSSVHSPEYDDEEIEDPQAPVLPAIEARDVVVIDEHAEPIRQHIVVSDPKILELTTEVQGLRNDLTEVKDLISKIVTTQDVKPDWIASSDQISSKLTQIISDNGLLIAAVNSNTKNIVRLFEQYNSSLSTVSTTTTSLRTELEKVVAHFENSKTAAEQQAAALNRVHAHLEKTGSSSSVVVQPQIPLPALTPSRNPPQSNFQGDKFCALCQAVGHETSLCSKYFSNRERVDRANELHLCQKCLQVVTFDANGAHLDIACRNCSHLFNDQEKSSHHLAFCDIKVPGRGKRQRPTSSRGSQRPTGSQYPNFVPASDANAFPLGPAPKKQSSSEK